MNVRLREPFVHRRFSSSEQLVVVFLQDEASRLSDGLADLGRDPTPMVVKSPRDPSLVVVLDRSLNSGGLLSARRDKWTATLSGTELERWQAFLRRAAGAHPPAADHIDLVDDARSEDLQLTLRVNRPIESVSHEEAARRLGLTSD